ncbi:hypothetical protein [Bifidobacterium xylocopae]|uniref:Conjugal transfer protein TrbL n=1 Tax=Bifidobacterium xylocopae TaxID=2493119 RepID=A0A366KAW0_9BIFI|nr:hypothetical protein [Bifidobacterium xylocopae]RBP98834.1 hypothetical protein CRD59_07010 [Bifidobacterium xylocopae]
MFNLIINGLLSWMVDGAVEGWKQACKLALQSGALTDNQWQVAQDVVGKLAGVMLYVVVITGAVAIVRNALARRVGDMFVSLGQAMFAWPLTVVTLYLLIQISNMASSLTDRILSVDMSKGDQSLNLPDLNVGSIKSMVSGPLLLFFALIIVLASASIILCMGARAFLLIVAVCFVCTAWMLLGRKETARQAKEYFSWVLGIILYQPICGLLIYITGKLMEASGSDNPITFITAVVGMVLSSVFPWVLVHRLLKVLPGASGLADAASAGRKTVTTTKKGAEQAVKIGAQVAGAIATGGASLAGGAALSGGAEGGGHLAGTDGQKSSAFSPRVDPGSGAATPSSQGADKGIGSSHQDDSEAKQSTGRERFARAVGAAASAVPKTAGVQAVINAAIAARGGGSGTAVPTVGHDVGKPAPNAPTGKSREAASEPKISVTPPPASQPAPDKREGNATEQPHQPAPSRGGGGQQDVRVHVDVNKEG